MKRTRLPTILGIGVDRIGEERIRQALDRFGERFEKRIFTRHERVHCRLGKDPVPCFAKRFAAKEALVKALGSGMAGGIFFPQVEVRSDALGKPGIRLQKKAKRRAKAMGAGRIHLSLTNDGGVAMAFVVIEKKTDWKLE